MKKWILIIVLVINIIGIGGCLWCNISTSNSLKKALLEQREDIQEVMSKLPPAIAVTADMTVTDKSKIDVNAKNNSGTVNVPTERVYILELQLDSTKITVERK